MYLPIAVLAIAGLLVTVSQSAPRADASAEAIPGTVADNLRNAVGAGNFHACAIDSNGGVQCWGTSASYYNDWGQLGQGNTNAYVGPQTVLGLSSGVKQIAVGNTHACAVLSADGSVKCWGRNYEGALGNGAATTGNASATPTYVITTTNANLTGVSDIATFDDHTCAVKSGAVLCWGYNIGGMGITGNTASTLLKATQVLASGAVSVAVGNDSSCAIMTDATVKCWGTGGKGQMGNAGALSYNNPAATVSGLSNVVALSVGLGTVCALRSNGDVMCWGSNLFGVVANGLCGFGSGSGEFSATPVGPVNNYIGVTGSENVVSISLSYSQGLALTDTGRTIKWGGGTGPCSAGSTWQQSLPAGVTVVGISASGTGLAQSCFVRSDAVIACSTTPISSFTVAGATAPDVPGTPTATGGNGQATITITPASGGSSPTSYLVTANPGGATCTITAPATSCTITGLTNGTAYTFTSTATNSFGTSNASASSTSVTPLAPPNTPSAPTATAGNGQATITVTPAQTGGAAATYTVTANPGGATCTITAPATSCTITGLTNGTAYTFTSTATNASGTSSASAASSSMVVNGSSSSASSSISSNDSTTTTKSPTTAQPLSSLTNLNTPTTGLSGNMFDASLQLLVCGFVLLFARKKLRTIA